MLSKLQVFSLSLVFTFLLQAADKKDDTLLKEVLGILKNEESKIDYESYYNFQALESPGFSKDKLLTLIRIAHNCFRPKSERKQELVAYLIKHFDDIGCWLNDINKHFNFYKIFEHNTTNKNPYLSYLLIESYTTKGEIKDSKELEQLFIQSKIFLDNNIPLADYKRATTKANEGKYHDAIFYFKKITHTNPKAIYTKIIFMYFKIIEKLSMEMHRKSANIKQFQDLQHNLEECYSNLNATISNIDLNKNPEIALITADFLYKFSKPEKRSMYQEYLSIASKNELIGADIIKSKEQYYGKGNLKEAFNILEKAEEKESVKKSSGVFAAKFKDFQARLNKLKTETDELGAPQFLLCAPRRFCKFHIKIVANGDSNGVTITQKEPNKKISKGYLSCKTPENEKTASKNWESQFWKEINKQSQQVQLQKIKSYHLYLEEYFNIKIKLLTSILNYAKNEAEQEKADNNRFKIYMTFVKNASQEFQDFPHYVYFIWKPGICPKFCAEKLTSSPEEYFEKKLNSLFQNKDNLKKKLISFFSDEPGKLTRKQLVDIIGILSLKNSRRSKKKKGNSNFIEFPKKLKKFKIPVVTVHSS